MRHLYSFDNFDEKNIIKVKKISEKFNTIDWISSKLHKDESISNSIIKRKDDISDVKFSSIGKYQIIEVFDFKFENTKFELTRRKDKKDKKFQFYLNKNEILLDVSDKSCEKIFDILKNLSI